MSDNAPSMGDIAWAAANRASDENKELRETVAALNRKVDRITFEASAQIEQLRARVAALEGKMK